MELRHLEHFVVVADEGHFTRAAGRLSLTQSGLSSSIKALERSLGVRLFARNTRRVELTDAGRAFYPGARRTLAAANSAEEIARGAVSLPRSTLRIGCAPVFGGLDIAGPLSRFTALHPAVEIDLTVLPGHQLLHGVARGDLELAFTTAPRRPEPDVALTPLETHPLVLVCARGSGLASREAVSLTELAGEGFVEFAEGTAVRAVNDEAFGEAGIERVVRVSCNDVTTLLELVAHDVGVALVSAALVTAARVPVATVPLRAPIPTWTIALATRPGGARSGAARALLSLIRPAVHPTPPGGRA